MNHEGPPLESLLRRLTETPQDFLAEPRMGDKGDVVVAAVLADTLRSFGLVPDRVVLDLGTAQGKGNDRNRLSVLLLLCWLLSDPALRARSVTATLLLTLFKESAAELAEQVPAEKFVSDPHRREELARVALARLDLRPQGETVSQAQDRLTSLSSAERSRVLKAARAGELRAREIREALARKAAEESADKWTRE